MRKSSFFAVALVLFISCSKSDPVPGPIQGENYMSLTVGSTRNYETTDNSGTTPVTSQYTLLSINHDTTVQTRTYHSFKNSVSGDTSFFHVSAGDHYQLQALPGGISDLLIENLFLRSGVAANASWTQNYNITIPGLPIAIHPNIINTIVEKGITHTVNGTTYTNVILVDTKITVNEIPAANLTTTIRSFYAPAVGLIENTTVLDLDYMGMVEHVDTRTILTSATIVP